MRWKIYYDDGSTCEGNTKEQAFAAPVKGVQLIKQEDQTLDPPYSTRHGHKWYTWERFRCSDPKTIPVKGWRWGAKYDDVGLADYLMHHEGAQKILIGREIHDQIFAEVMKRSKAEGCLCCDGKHK